MVREFRTEARLAMDAATYWAEKDSDGFRDQMCAVLDFEAMTELESWEEGGESYSRVETKPNVALPAMVKRLVGSEKFSLIDTIVVGPDVPPYAWTFTTATSVFTDKTSISGTVRIVPQGDGSCLQVCEGSVGVAVWGVGSVVERLIINGIAETYAKLPAVVDAWNAVRARSAGPSARTPLPDDEGHDHDSGISLYYDAGAGSGSDWGAAFSVPRSPELHRARSRSIEARGVDVSGFVSAASGYGNDDDLLSVASGNGDDGRGRRSATGGVGRVASYTSSSLSLLSSASSSFISILSSSACCFSCARPVHHHIDTHHDE